MVEYLTYSADQVLRYHLEGVIGQLVSILVL